MMMTSVRTGALWRSHLRPSRIACTFVPGAASNLVRSLSYFPDAATAMQWTILVCWLIGGVVLTLIGHFRDQADLRVPADQLEPAPDAGAEAPGRSAVGAGSAASQ